uniref:Uncharacterized protein n=1 Tax=Anguilla anguilla TaxID=7936 RepID=A0A0E9S2M8_ANGAN
MGKKKHMVGHLLSDPWTFHLCMPHGIMGHAYKPGHRLAKQTKMDVRAFGSDGSVSCVAVSV